MGLRLEYLEFIEECAKTAGVDFRDKKMLELGNQKLSRSARRFRKRTGKEYYTRRGVTHVSIDLNGKDGALRLDLSQIIDRPEWLNYFDIITNAGTSEHVEPYEAQYNCFKNLHDWLRVGGIAIHIVPCVEELESNGRWRNHCNNYYSRPFFEELAVQNSYTIVASERINHLGCVCFSKDRDVPFMADVDGFLKNITRREGGKVYPGINDSSSPSEEPGGSSARRIARSILRRLGLMA